MPFWTPCRDYPRVAEYDAITFKASAGFSSPTVGKHADRAAACSALPRLAPMSCDRDPTAGALTLSSVHLPLCVCTAIRGEPDQRHQRPQPDVLAVLRCQRRLQPRLGKTGRQPHAARCAAFGLPDVPCAQQFRSTCRAPSPHPWFKCSRFRSPARRSLCSRWPVSWLATWMAALRSPCSSAAPASLWKSWQRRVVGSW